MCTKTIMQLKPFTQSIYNTNYCNIADQLNIISNGDYIFYYDETNNDRKIKINQDRLNLSMNNLLQDFVLGGVMVKGNANIDISALKKAVHLQADELKLKHLGGKGLSFFDCMKQKKIRIFLEWLSEQDIYIHYSNVNKLYYISTEIIDSVCQANEMRELLDYNKTLLYHFILKDYNFFENLMIHNHYPVMSKAEIKNFYTDLLHYIQSRYNDNPNYLSLISLLMKGRDIDQMAFWGDNLIMKNGEVPIWTDFSDCYIERLAMFHHSKHIFDQESEIAKILNRYNIVHDDHVIRYEFIDSKDITADLIQISDCFIGLVGKFYTTLNTSIITNQYYEYPLDNNQKNSLKYFGNLLKKSDDFCMPLLSGTTERSVRQLESSYLNQFIQF